MVSLSATAKGPVMAPDFDLNGFWQVEEENLLKLSARAASMSNLAFEVELLPDSPGARRAEGEWIFTGLEGIREGTRSNATFTWIDTEFLQEKRVRAYSHMPLWMPAEGSNTGFNRFDLSRILARGIKYRPLPITASITAERETELLAAWHIRGG